jgi:hypothetical protein
LILQSKFNYNNWVQFDSKNFTHNTAMKKAKFLKLHCLVGGWCCKVTHKTITLSIKVLSLILCEPTLRIYEFSPCNLNFSSVQTNPNCKNLFFNSNVNILLNERLNTLQAFLIWNLKCCFFDHLFSSVKTRTKLTIASMPDFSITNLTFTLQSLVDALLHCLSR